jgi:hypothetical protein
MLRYRLEQEQLRMARSLTLATSDLSMAQTLLIRSNLKLFEGKTRDHWTHVETLPATATVCSASSWTSNAASMKASGSGESACFALLSKDEAAPIGASSLAYPARAQDLAAILDAISGRISSFATREIRTAAQSSGRASPDRAQPRSFKVALALRELLTHGSRGIYCIKANGVELHVVPATRTLLTNSSLDENLMARLLAADAEILVKPASDSAARKLELDGVSARHVDGLLWRLGIDGSRGGLPPALPRDGCYALKRWPDFGRIPHDRLHVRMASLLTRKALTVDQLANASGSEIEDARRFISACWLFDLIDIRPRLAQSAPQSKPRSTGPIPARRFSGVFDSIRSALGFRAT